MSKQYSDWFSDDATGLVYNSQKRLSAGVTHSRLRYRRAEVTLDLAPAAWTIADQCRLMQIHSSDRIVHIYLTTDGLATAGAGDLGLYKSGAAHDGAAVSVDCFGAAHVLSTAIARTDHVASGTPDIYDRGKPAWFFANTQEAGTDYSADTNEAWDIVLLATTTLTGADMGVIVELLYTAGD